MDYMSNEIIRNYFHINPHFKIEWINDSSCNLVFNSDTEAQEAVLPLAKGEGMRDENEGTNHDLTQFGMNCRSMRLKGTKGNCSVDWQIHLM